MLQKEYDPLYKGFFQERDRVFIFGPRVARAIMLHALVSGEQFVKDGLRMSYRELKTFWPQAVLDGLMGSQWRCGLVTFLKLIEERKNQIHQTTECDEVVFVIKNLNHQVFNDLWRIAQEQVVRKPVVQERKTVGSVTVAKYV